MLKIAAQTIVDDIAGVTIEVREDRLVIWRHPEALMGDGCAREIGIGGDGMESFAGTYMQPTCPDRPPNE